MVRAVPSPTGLPTSPDRTRQRWYRHDTNNERYDNDSSQKCDKEGKQEDFLKAVQPLIEASRAERGNVFYDLYEDVADSRAFCFIERWADEEAVAAHNASPHFRAWTAAKAEFVEAGTVARYRQR